MNRQYFNSRNLQSNDGNLLFDTESVGAAQAVTPLTYHESDSPADINGSRFRVIVRKTRNGRLDKIVFALSLLAVAILGCVAGTLLHFSGAQKSATSSSRYTNSAEIQTATLLKPSAMKNSFTESAMNPAPVAVQPPVPTAQMKSVAVNYQVSPKPSEKTVAASSSNFQIAPESESESAEGHRIVRDIRDKMKRESEKNKNSAKNSEIEDAERMGRELRNWLERENK